MPPLGQAGLLILDGKLVRQFQTFQTKIYILQGGTASFEHASEMVEFKDFQILVKPMPR